MYDEQAINIISAFYICPLKKPLMAYFIILKLLNLLQTPPDAFDQLVMISAWL